MSIIFEKTDSRKDIYNRLVDHVNKGIGDGSIVLHPSVPAIMHWKGYPDSKMKLLGHPGDAAKLIEFALSREEFSDCSAHVVFDNSNGFMLIFITDDPMICFSDVYNSKVEGTA